MRTWNTLLMAPPQWGKIQGIPSDFADGRIDWNEVANKPETFTPHPDPLIKEATFAAIEFDGSAGVNYLDFHVRGSEERADYDGRIICFFHDNTIPSSTESGLASIQFHALNLGFTGNIYLNSLPSTPVGLSTGQVWRDSNGFLRIV